MLLVSGPLCAQFNAAGSSNMGGQGGFAHVYSVGYLAFMDPSSANFAHNSPDAIAFDNGATAAAPVS
jgi:hypothetical protein